MTFVDNILNRITMYRLVLYYLFALIALSAVLGTFGVLPYTPVALLFSTFAFAVACLVANWIFSRAFDAVPGRDSTLITALILVLIVNPIQPTDVPGMALIGFISFWAIGSKYILALGKKHIFNPAAFGVALSALLVGQGATWWVAGNLSLMPLLVLGGLLIVRKIERFDLVLSFAVVALATVVLTSLADPVSGIVATLAHSSFFFLAFVMLTEPATMPPQRWQRIIYGAIAGLLFAPAVHLASFYFTPETALLAANVFAYAVSPKGRRIFTLRARHKLANGTYEFVFTPDRPLRFRAGQYLEWTVPGAGSDARGNRRYLTIASAPSEKEVRIGVKFYKPMSTFKRALLALQLGDTISAAHLAGTFVLPKKPKRKLAFIAGGIGVTPFRSIVGELLATNNKRDAVLLYANKHEDGFAYQDIFDAAREEIGMKTVYAERIDPAMLVREIPDYRERTFYISGPRSMVVSFERTLQALGVRRGHIKIDYFPGFA
jgi:ferredoxin-NADP reductase/Na+-translocating ferredoxin:NAD+ oxidoreductase RnfD subunit